MFRILMGFKFYVERNVMLDLYVVKKNSFNLNTMSASLIFKKILQLKETYRET